MRYHKRIYKLKGKFLLMCTIGCAVCENFKDISTNTDTPCEKNVCSMSNCITNKNYKT